MGLIGFTSLTSRCVAITFPTRVSLVRRRSHGLARPGMGRCAPECCGVRARDCSGWSFGHYGHSRGALDRRAGFVWCCLVF